MIDNKYPTDRLRRMAKNQHQNGVIPGGGTMTDPDDFSDGESTPLTQDYGGRYGVYTFVNDLLISRFPPTIDPRTRETPFALYRTLYP